MAGFGGGYARVAFEPIMAVPSIDAFEFLVAGGVELEALQHVFAGVMLTSSVLGEPGDTEASANSAMFYAGVRF